MIINDDAAIYGGASINYTLPNYIIGNGSLNISNTPSNIENTATQYILNTNSINTSEFNGCLTISIWFNPSSLSSNNIYTLFDLASTTGTKGIQVDLSGLNQIYSALYY